jgi:hypothetical protein
MTEPSKDIVLHQRTAPALPSDAEINRMYRLAKALVISGMFKDTLKAEQAFSKMLLGRDLGLSPTEAMTSIHLVEGKPELSANLQAAMLRAFRSPEGERYDYRVRQLTTEKCLLVFMRITADGEVLELGESTFTLEDAKAAGLAGRPTWKSYARNMLFARALSNGVAWHCPEVTFGHRTYTDSEIGGELRDPDALEQHVELEAAAIEEASDGTDEQTQAMARAVAEADDGIPEVL